MVNVNKIKILTILLLTICITVFLFLSVDWNLRLKQFEDSTLYDPILALPGTDLEELRKSVAALRESQNLYLSYYSQSEQESIKKLLHPFEFLESLAELEQTRRDFLNNPGYFNAVKYSFKQRHSLVLLRRYSQELSDFVLSLSNSDARIAAPAGITSRDYVALQIAKSYEEANKKLGKVNRRFFCLLGISPTTDCKINFPEIIEPEILPADFNLSKTERYGEVMREYIFENKPDRYSLTDEEPENLPLVYINNSACTSRSYGTYIFTWRPSRSGGLLSLWMTPVEELLFHNAQKRVTEFDHILADVGVTYEYQPLNYYMCVDSSLDIGRVRSAYYFKDWLKNSPIITKYKENEFPQLEQLHGLEAEILNQDDIIYVSGIEQYIALAQRLLYEEPQLLLGLKPEEQRRLLEAITLWRSQSAWLESEVNKADDLAVTTLYASRHIEIPMDALFLSRSYYSLFLLSGNLTLHDKPLSFIEEKVPTLIGTEGLIDYETSLKHLIPLESLPDFITSQAELSNKVYGD